MLKKKKLAQYRALAITRYRRRSTRFIRQISREIGPKRRRQAGGRAGVLRTLLVLLAVGTAGYLLLESGALDRIRHKLKSISHAEKAASTRPAKVKSIPAAASKDPAKADSVKAAGAARKGLFERWFGQKEIAPPAVAFVRLDELYGLSESGVVLSLLPRTYYDLPMISLSAPASASTGDTLEQAVIAAKVAEAAGRLAPSLAARIAEIRVADADAVDMVFSDCPLRARLTGRGIDGQIINLAAYLSAAGKRPQGLLNLEDGNIAYLKEEE